MDKLKEGEQYLSLVIFGKIPVACFPNKNKTKPNEPDFIGNGIAIWLRNKGSDKPRIDSQAYSNR